MRREDISPAFGKSDDIERSRECLRNIKRNPDTSSGFKSERFGNDRIRSSGTDFYVGRYGCH
ncbi:hypothetical protein ES707_08520 [subsurface metagenome]